MPDWSYHTLLRPMLFAMPAERSRQVTLAATGALGRSRFGRGLINLMGHMRPPAEIAVDVAGISAASPVGLAAGLDPDCRATEALALFGFGFMEIGPVGETPLPGPEVARVTADQSVIWKVAAHAPPFAVSGVDAVLETLSRMRGPLPPLAFRLAHSFPEGVMESGLVPRQDSGPAESAQINVRLMDRLKNRAAAYVLPPPNRRWSLDDLRTYLATTLAASTLPIWLAVKADDPRILDIAGIAVAGGVKGIVVGGGIVDQNGDIVSGAPEKELIRSAVLAIAAAYRGRIAMITAGGVIEPRDAIALREAGADLVMLDCGIAYGGPGLAKRINETILATDVKWKRPACNWIWLLALGVSMIFGGLMAAVIAATCVILPYDEAFVGMGRAGILQINPHLLEFMAHDRITLAGTMTSIGVLYTMMAWHGARMGAHWAWRAITVSSMVGFASFFLFLGFGYFDPLHAAVSGILFVFFNLALANRPVGVGLVRQDLKNDVLWRRSLWGQLVFIVTGIGLISAGIAIAGVGITHVFVPTDLMFLHSSHHAIMEANSRLLPLIAHDRAGFGGSLVSDGIAVLLLSLWGFRRGARWVWDTLLFAGLPGFIAALGVHIAIGYMAIVHLFPVYLATTLFIAGLTLSHGYLTDNRSE